MFPWYRTSSFVSLALRPTDSGVVHTGNSRCGLLKFDPTIGWTQLTLEGQNPTSFEVNVPPLAIEPSPL